MSCYHRSGPRTYATLTQMEMVGLMVKSWETPIVHGLKVQQYPKLAKYVFAEWKALLLSNNLIFGSMNLKAMRNK